ncbi:MAG: spermidine synthase [Dictyoglomus sp. NZ13-RE01]|nr:MAG: spermidine synthase [Dictyoglomus sp. NZ13-RE01]
MNAYWLIEKNHPSEIHWHGIEKFIYVDETPYQKVEIIESPFYGVCLVLDGRIQSSEKDEFIYHEALVHPAMILHPSPQRVLILGGGEGATLREVLKYKEVEKAVMVDIDEKVVKISQEFLKSWHKNSFFDKRVSLLFRDARAFLEETDEKFDVIISDLSEPMAGSPSVKLFTYEFYNIVKNHLTENGIFVMQASTSHHLKLKFHSVMSSTLRNIFGMVFSYQAYVPVYDFIWSFIFASDKINPKEFSEDYINKRLEEKNIIDLRFYDGETHKMMFSLPKHVREIIEKENTVAYDSNPLYMVED